MRSKMSQLSENIKICILLLSGVVSVLSYKTYQQKIPNGASVSDPCSTGQNWPGVGHYAIAGHGARNAFGVAFKNAGRTWTAALCQADSDGDGKTNGFELGDPNCVWSVGNTPARIINITNPGICDPVTSDACKSKNSLFNLTCTGTISGTRFYSPEHIFVVFTSLLVVACGNIY